jgi:hypothetical protein
VWVHGIVGVDSAILTGIHCLRKGLEKDGGYKLTWNRCLMRVESAAWEEVTGKQVLGTSDLILSSSPTLTQTRLISRWVGYSDLVDTNTDRFSDAIYGFPNTRLVPGTTRSSRGISASVVGLAPKLGHSVLLALGFPLCIPAYGFVISTLALPSESESNMLIVNRVDTFLSIKRTYFKGKGEKVLYEHTI